MGTCLKNKLYSIFHMVRGFGSPANHSQHRESKSSVQHLVEERDSSHMDTGTVQDTQLSTTGAWGTAYIATTCAAGDAALRDKQGHLSEHKLLFCHVGITPTSKISLIY